MSSRTLLTGQLRFPYAEELFGKKDAEQLLAAAGKAGGNNASQKNKKTIFDFLKPKSNGDGGTAPSSTAPAPKLRKVADVRHVFSSQIHEYAIYHYEYDQVIADKSSIDRPKSSIEWKSVKDLESFHLVSTGQRKILQAWDGSVGYFP